VPDHAKIAIKELHAAIHNANEAVLRLTHTLAHISFTTDLKIDGSELFNACQILEREVLPALIKCAKEASGPQDEN